MAKLKKFSNTVPTTAVDKGKVDVILDLINHNALSSVVETPLVLYKTNILLLSLFQTEKRKPSHLRQ